VVGYGKDADHDGYQVGALLSHELADISSVRVFIPQGISTREAIELLRKIAEMIETTDSGLQRFYQMLAFPPTSSKGGSSGE
jgi:hypothetical protein